MKMSKKLSKDKKSFSYRMGEVFGTAAGAIVGAFSAPPSPADARNRLDKKGRERLKIAKKQALKNSSPKRSPSKKRH